jgi:hypothetical protein
LYKTLRTMNNLFGNAAFDSPERSSANYFQSKGYRNYTTTLRKEDLLNPHVAFQMATGRIPDLGNLCLELAETFNYRAPHSAKQVIPVLQKMHTLDPEQVKRFIKNPETRHILISNHLFELVLIHWKPGKASDIHGHPGGGCVFKLLQGKLEELRYTPEKSSKLMSTHSLRKGSMAYIDDSIAYHQVGNPYGSSAISLHAYLK